MCAVCGADRDTRECRVPCMQSGHLLCVRRPRARCWVCRHARGGARGTWPVHSKCKLWWRGWCARPEHAVMSVGTRAVSWAEGRCCGVPLCGCVPSVFCFGYQVVCGVLCEQQHSKVGWSGVVRVCVCGHIYRRHTHPGARQGGGVDNRLTGADKNVPVWQGPLGRPPSRYPGRNPACQGQRLPLPQHREQH